MQRAVSERLAFGVPFLHRHVSHWVDHRRGRAQVVRLDVVQRLRGSGQQTDRKIVQPDRLLLQRAGVVLSG